MDSSVSSARLLDMSKQILAKRLQVRAHTKLRIWTSGTRMACTQCNFEAQDARLPLQYVAFTALGSS